MPLKSLVPVFSYDIPKSLSLNEALHLFNLLFKKGLFLSQKKLFDQKRRMLKARLFVGSLRLFEGYAKPNSGNYQYQNLARKLMLAKSDASLIGTNTFFKIDESETIKGIYDYGYYQTLFLEYDRKGFYNLHNYDFYDREDFTLPIEEGKSACIALAPLESALEDKGLSYKEKEISVPEAVQLFRRLERKKSTK